jgi:hypothetical protein
MHVTDSDNARRQCLRQGEYEYVTHLLTARLRSAALLLPGRALVYAVLVLPALLVAAILFAAAAVSGLAKRACNSLTLTQVDSAEIIMQREEREPHLGWLRTASRQGVGTGSLPT